MKFIKGLWATGLSVFSVMILGGVPSVFYERGYDWLRSLQLPPFVMSKFLFLLTWCLVLLIMVCFLVCIIINKVPKKIYIILLAVSVIQIAGLILFFELKSIYSGLIASAAVVTLLGICFRLLGKYRYCNALLFPYFTWVCYILTVNYCIVLLN